MLDPKFLELNPEESVRRLMRKGEDETFLRDTIEQLRQRRKRRTELDELRARMNSRSREIGKALSTAPGPALDAFKTEVSEIKTKLQDLEESYRSFESSLQDRLLRLPNFPADECPEGQREQQNVVTRYVNYDPNDYQGRTFRAHWEIGAALGIYDAERASKISGAMFALLKGDGAKLLHALVQLGLSLHRDKYIEILPPHFVTTATFTATGHLPKFENEAYRLRDDELWAIPTGEVPLMSIHRDEILKSDALPKRYMAYTVCFRREAGSGGKDTRGMQRLHEFHKVELVKLCMAEQVESEFKDMLSDAEKILKLLNLPYRLVDICSGDLTFSAARVFDLEVYAPGVERWLEVSSVGSFTDFQARRGNTRYRDRAGRLHFVHALNGSAIATPRVWAAILEHNLLPDGSVRVPEALRDYMGTDVIRARATVR